jgi:hypothetical protein
MSRIPRRRLSDGGVPNNPTIFQPGNQLSRGRGRPPGSRNRTTNLVVAGITAAVIEYGRDYARSRNLPADHNVMSDVEAFAQFIRYCIDKDLRGAISLIRGLVPKDVTLTFSQPPPAAMEIIPPQQLLELLDQRGLRIPPGYQLTAAHNNDDDQVTEAEIIEVVEAKR